MTRKVHPDWPDAFAEYYPKARNRYQTELPTSFPGKKADWTATTPAFFIVGCARSGTTALAEILGGASNAVVLSEPEPNLAIESRRALDGTDVDLGAAIRRAVKPRVDRIRANGLIYGEKNVTLTPMIAELAKAFRAKIILVRRDGRDAVTSMMNWHGELFGNIYREAVNRPALSPAARKAVAGNPAPLDSSDYARPRPRRDDPLKKEWNALTRLEMCAWYWATINQTARQIGASLPADTFYEIDMSSAKASDIQTLADAIGLKGLSPEAVSAQLDARINATSARVETEPRFPKPADWSNEQISRFDAMAFDQMRELGYYPTERHREKPDGFGDWWRQHDGGLDWYEWMYRSRQSAHDDLKAFVADLDAAGAAPDSVLDMGCGLGVGYADHFKDRRFVGVDISEKEIEWCRKNRKADRHDYIATDLIAEPLTEKFDLVFSQGTIDNVYDIDAFLSAAVAMSKGWVYITAYRGWFPQLNQHEYRWDPATTCYYNNISPAMIQKTLEKLGCRKIRVEALPMKGAAVSAETRITAQVAAVAG
jgi:SAM-dependent methyltransferase